MKWICTFILGCVVASPAFGAESQRGLVLFEKQVRPTLIENCQQCHGEKKQKGGLRLDSRAGWTVGGDNGPAIVPGDPDKSLLMKAIGYEHGDLEMPPKGKLPDGTIGAFRDWVALGAPDPRDGVVAVVHAQVPTVEEGRNFWSFQPIRKPSIPAAKSDWPRTDIDQFIYARLSAEQLEPAEDALKHTLARRLYFDLLGLPPTPEQIATFLNDSSPKAFGSLVDELLNSPHFGERWGRHWLDVVRFAESSGGGRTALFPDAWRYRDYVINAFNDDLPYDRFLREQIAGDLLPLPAGDWQQQRRQMIATAFLLLGPTNFELQDKTVLEMDIVDEQLDTMGKAVMGMTIGCARCHDHKFDPIPARDYYAMAGIMKSTLSVVHSNVSKWSEAKLPLPPKEEAEIAAAGVKLAELEKLLAATQKKLKAAGGQEPETKGGAKGVKIESLPGIVVDDVDAEYEGDWVSSTSTRSFVGVGYHHDATAGKGMKTATFAAKLKPGRYEVQVSYPAAPNRSSKVPVTVHHADGAATMVVNQRSSGEIAGNRDTLGTFRFDATKQPKVVISNAGTEDGVVLADSVIFIRQAEPQVVVISPLPKADEVDIPENIKFIVPDPLALEGIVIDNPAAVLVGEWKHSVHTPPFVGASYIHDAKEGKGEKSATFIPYLPDSGTYEVRISHNTNIRRSTNAPVTIKHAGGEFSVRINEGEEAPINKLFRSLGKFRFDAGTNGQVRISNEGTDGKYVIVDSVQFIRQPDAPKRSGRIDFGLSERKVQKDKKKIRTDLLNQVKDMRAKIKKLKADGPKQPIAMVAKDEDEVTGDIPIAIRGVVHDKGPIVPRGFLQVASIGPLPTVSTNESGRVQMADWLASPKHPLTARVMANRVWHWLMGEGLVRTVDNFGAMGEPPSHPELLDHLASQLIEDNWSMKKLIRRIVVSQTYRMAAATNPEGVAKDPDNRLLWRMNRKRLDAESIRDALYHIGGSLDLTLGGKNIKAGTRSEYGYLFESTRRSVYLPVFRNQLPEIFETFDFADPNIQGGKRNTSTIAPQALLLMNHPDVRAQSVAAARRLLKQTELTSSERIDRAYREVIGRQPTHREAKLTGEFVGTSEEAERWGSLYQTLFQTLDFRYLY
jgi:cytochrome c553